MNVTRLLADMAKLPSNWPWTKIRATLFLFSAVLEPRNDSAISWNIVMLESEVKFVMLIADADVYKHDFES
jgi:hypothetical protein